MTDDDREVAGALDRLCPQLLDERGAWASVLCDANIEPAVEPEGLRPAVSRRRLPRRRKRLALAVAAAAALAVPALALSGQLGSLFGSDGGGASRRAPIGASTWSPDGRQIAWQENRRIWIADRDGSNARPITRAIDALGQMHWLPFGELVYSANSRLFALEPGGRARRVTSVQVDTFTLDRAGRRLAAGPPPCPRCVGPVVVVTLPSGATRMVGARGEQNGQPSISPDGTRVAFSRYLCAGGDCYENSGIWVAPVDRGDSEQLTSRGGCPSWSPDGARIAYVDMTDATLRVVPASGGPSDVLLRNVRCRVSLPPQWSPDSRSLAVVEGRDGWLTVVDVTTKRRRAVTSLATKIVTQYAWSRDSKRLLVTAKPALTSCSSLWLARVEPRVQFRLLRECR